MRTLLFACLVIIAISGCKNTGLITDSGPEDTSATASRFLVELEYVNWAWGYNHAGLIVDNAGRVYSWRYERSDSAWQPNEAERYTYAQLQSKFAHNRVLKGTIGADTLGEIRSLIPSADDGEFSDRRMVGADMGQTNRVAWQYDASSGLYQRVLLKTTGDWDQERTAVYPRRLAELIDAIAARYGDG